MQTVIWIGVAVVVVGLIIYVLTRKKEGSPPSPPLQPPSPPSPPSPPPSE